MGILKIREIWKRKLWQRKPNINLKIWKQLVICWRVRQYVTKMRPLDSSRVSARPYILAKEILSGISCPVY